MRCARRWRGGELAALLEHGQLLVRGIAHARLQRAELLDQRQHVAPIGAERLRIRIDAGLQDGHQCHPRGVAREPGPSADVAARVPDISARNRDRQRITPPAAASGARRGGSRSRAWSGRAAARSTWRLALGAAPSTRSVSPEMKAAAGDSRKTIAAETSASVPKRCSGVWRRSERSMGLTLGGIGVEAGRGDPARRHGVDAHAGGAPFGRRRRGEVDHARPRGAAVAHARHAVPHVGDDVDDRARRASRIHCV